MLNGSFENKFPKKQFFGENYLLDPSTPLLDALINKMSQKLSSISLQGLFLLTGLFHSITIVQSDRFPVTDVLNIPISPLLQVSKTVKTPCCVGLSHFRPVSSIFERPRFDKSSISFAKRCKG